jgi:hypothetical protein
MSDCIRDVGAQHLLKQLRINTYLLRLRNRSIAPCSTSYNQIIIKVLRANSEYRAFSFSLRSIETGELEFANYALTLTSG